MLSFSSSEYTQKGVKLSYYALKLQSLSQELYCSGAMKFQYKLLILLVAIPSVGFFKLGEHF